MPGGGNPDYNSLAVWEADSDNDLAGYSGPVTLGCYDSQDHADSCAVAGATNTSTTIYREIRSASGCATAWGGKAGTGANIVATSGAYAIVPAENYFSVRDLYLEVSIAQVGGVVGAINIETTPAIVGLRVTNCVLKGICVGGSGYGFYQKWSGSNWLLNNVIANDCTTSGIYLQLWSLQAVCDISLVGCVTLRNGSYGINSTGNDVSAITRVFNCYSADNGTADFSVSVAGAGSNWNASKDASALSLGEYAKGGLDLVTLGKMDTDGLALANDLYNTSGTSPGAHRYWRINIYGTSPAFAWSMAEIEMRESQGGSDVTGSGTASASSSYDGTTLPANVVDNDTGTLWATATTDPAWWKYDFGNGVTKTIVEVVITPRQTGLYTQTPNYFAIQYSDDDSAWTTALTGITAWENANAKTFNVLTGKYGRNPYNDFTAVTDFYDFFKNDTAGNALSLKDIRGTDRPNATMADSSWNVGASQSSGKGWKVAGVLDPAKVGGVATPAKGAGV